MATDSTEISNIALVKVGTEQISDITDANKRARTCNTIYPKLRKRLLRAHPWNFAIKRSSLSRVNDVSTSVAAATDLFTSASTLNMETGDRISITLNSGTIPSPLIEGQTYYAIKISSLTFKLASTQENAAAGTAIDITDSPTFNATFFIGAPFEYDAKFVIPSDYLRSVREEDKDTDWKREGDYILSNTTIFNLLYIADITDTTKFDASFDQLLAQLMAVEMSETMVQSRSVKQALQNEYFIMLKDIRSFDAQEGSPEEYEADEWLESRL